jgi:hypothetical protein
MDTDVTSGDRTGLRPCGAMSAASDLLLYGHIFLDPRHPAGVW